MLLKSVCLLLFVHASAASSLYDTLQKFTFLNEGTTTSRDRFHFEAIKPVGPGQVAIYLEPDNISCTQCVWADQAKYYAPHPYLFLTNKSAPGPSSSFHELSGLDWTAGSVIADGNKNIKPTEDACKAQCAPNPACMAGLFINGSVRHGVNAGFDQPLQPKAEQTSVARVQGNRAHRSRVMEQDQEGQASTLV
jgi:hypothetical protein